jgi:putative membrane protein
MFFLRAFPWSFLIFGGVLPFLFWLALGVLAAIVILSLMGSSSKPKPTNPSALDILKERYAKGEITKEDYETMRHTLNA